MSRVLKATNVSASTTMPRLRPVIVRPESETEIGGRLAYIGTCFGGARTYHTYLEEQGFIVSITATGERRFGELILAGLAG